ncbi:hypothetical protein [Streptomyces sp. LN245]|uniref:hypothetical protein n=1 Tax=Streptomyces sp. LN245 TaxID=3112975 RepID=UPI0037107CA3
MSTLKIAMILGSTRPGRNGKAVADGASTARSPALAPSTNRSTSPTVRCPSWTSPSRRPWAKYQGEQSRTA